MNTRVNRTICYLVCGWMTTDFHLKGIEKEIFAMVYCASQDGESEFSRSLADICEITGATKPTVISALKSLVEKGCILRRECRNADGVIRVYYKANLDYSPY